MIGILAAGSLTTGALPARAAAPAAGSGGALLSNGPATPLDHVAFEWAINNQHQAASQAGGCDYFVAGESDGYAGTYRTRSGNVQIIKRAADGSVLPVGVPNRCRAEGTGGTIGQRMLFTEGVGEIRTDGSATVSWKGRASVNAYGGLVPWYLENPRLEVDTHGDGRIVGDLGGIGSSYANPMIRQPLEPMSDVTVMDFSDIRITPTGFTATPKYTHVDYVPLTDAFRPELGRLAISAITPATRAANPNWGSWNPLFVDFQYRTGLSSYWHSSGGEADSKKPPLPFDIRFNFSTDDSQNPPSVFLGPETQSVSAGGTVVLTAAATGAPVPRFQWQREIGGVWTDLPGATSSTLRLVGLTIEADNGARYRTILTNDRGSATTEAATITVVAYRPVVIVTPPTDTTAAASGSAFIIAAATGSALRYRWETSKDNGQTWSEAGTLSYLSLADLRPDQNGLRYRVTVSNGVDTVTTTPATLTVTTKPLAITYGEYNRTVFHGRTVRLVTYFDGAPYGVWTWERSTDNGKTWKPVKVIRNANNVDHVFVADRADSGDLYRVQGDNGAGPAVAAGPWRITVLDPTNTGPEIHVSGIDALDPTIAHRLPFTGAGFPLHQEFPTGTARSLAVRLIEVGTWEPGQAIDTYLSARGVGLAADGYLSETLLTMNAGVLDVNKKYEVITYRAAVPSDTRYITRTPVHLLRPPTIEQQPTSRTVTADGTAEFSVTVDADFPLSYQWQRSDDDGDTWTDLPDADATSVEVTAKVRDSGALFRVVVSTIGGTVTSHEARLTVRFDGAPVITQQPKSLSATVGDRFVLETQATGSYLSFQWQVSMDGSAWAEIDGGDSRRLAVQATSTALSGARYRAVVTNPAGDRTTDVATLTVAPAVPTVRITAAKSAVYGGSTYVGVTVAAPQSVPTSGKVTLKAGSTVLGTASLTAGSARWTVKTAGLKVGSNKITVVFGGSDELRTAVTTTTLSVTKAVSTTRTAVAAGTIKVAGRPKVTISVAAVGTSPTGKVRVDVVAMNGKNKGRTMAGVVKTLSKASATRGAASITLPAVRAKGSYQIRTTYTGSSVVTAGKAKAVTLTVK
ncbi:hypothetical protein D1871_18345 [Nakamurella silvestris]|nr:hypothetical protein D1871_18345 [Nakamurella silvestris]